MDQAQEVVGNTRPQPRAYKHYSTGRYTHVVCGFLFHSFAQFMKRARPEDFNPKGGFKYPVKRVKGPTGQPMLVATKAPVRAYAGSMVPLVSRGYQPNTKERKVSDVSPSTISVDTTGAVQLLHCPVPGTDMTNRIGRKTCPRSVAIRAQISITPATGGAPIADCVAQTVRWILFVDFQPSGAAPAITDLLTAASPFAHLNLNNRDRFKVLRDKIFNMGPIFYGNTATQTYAVGENLCKVFKVYKKINGIETIFNTGSAGTIADISSGALYSCWIGSTAAGSTDCAAVMTSRVRFDDA